MSEAVFMQAVGKHVEAIRLCLDNRLFMPALVLIFSGIDFASALARPASKPEAQRSDFIDWIDRYMPCDRLGLAGTDLYGARCGVVHAMTSDSRLQREGKVKRVSYTWSTAKSEPSDADVMIQVEALFDAFLAGLTAFQQAIEQDEPLRQRVLSRTVKMIADHPDPATDSDP